MERGSDFLDMRAVGTDGLVQHVAGDSELLRPVGDVGGQFGVDLLGVVRAFGVFFVDRVGDEFLGGLLVFVLVLVVGQVL